MTTFDSTPLAHPTPVGNTGLIVVHVPSPSSLGVGLGASDGLVGSVAVSSVDDVTEGVAVVLDVAARVPVLNAARAFDPTHVDVYFSEPMDFSGALVDPAQWSTSSLLLTVVAVRRAGPLRARLTVTEMRDGASYTVTAPASAASAAGRTLDAARRSARLVGVGGRPFVARVERLTQTRLRVHFSEPMALTAALRSSSSYALTPTDGGASVFVGKVTPDPFAAAPPAFVDLDVTEQTNGRTYSLVASVVTDVAGNLVTTTPTTILGEGDAPAISRIIAVSRNRVDVAFNKAVRKTRDAFDASRYAWDNGLSTVSVVKIEKNVVSLVTTDQDPGVVYTLTISATPSDSWGAIVDMTTTQGSPFSFAPTYNNPDDDVVAFSVVGSLPAGLVVSATTGVVSGASTTPGTQALRMRATHPDGSTTDSALFHITVTAALLTPPDVASGAGFNPVRWYTAQSPDGNLPTLLIDGQDAPITWHDFGSEAVDLPYNGVPAHVKWRANGGPGGARPSMEWVSQQPSGGPADMFAFAPGGVTTVPAMTMAFVFKRTDANGVLRFLVGTGPGDPNRQVYVGEVGNAGVGAANHSPELRDDTLPASLPQTSYCWAIIEFNDASSRVKVGDGTTTHETTGTIGNGDHQMQGYFLGSFHAQQTQGDFSWIGFIQDFVVYAAVDATLRAQLTTYLNNKLAGL